jgi:acetoin utilization deacetylase AcuC-like enzyme
MTWTVGCHQLNRVLTHSNNVVKSANPMQGYALMTERLTRLAGGRCMAALEGGYGLTVRAVHAQCTWTHSDWKRLVSTLEPET